MAGADQDSLPTWPNRPGRRALPPRPFYFLRHGQTDWNLQSRAQGQIDIDLNARGRVQAANAATGLRGLPIKTICASPLRRAWETAQTVQGVLGCPLIAVDGLKEAAWGDKEGAIRGAWFSDWTAGREAPVGAEPIDVFLDRALDGVLEALEEPAPVLIVSHGAVYWAVERALARPASDLPNCVAMLHRPLDPGGHQWVVGPIGESE